MEYSGTFMCMSVVIVARVCARHQKYTPQNLYQLFSRKCPEFLWPNRLPHTFNSIHMILEWTFVDAIHSEQNFNSYDEVFIGILVSLAHRIELLWAHATVCGCCGHPHLWSRKFIIVEHNICRRFYSISIWGVGPTATSNLHTQHTEFIVYGASYNKYEWEFEWILISSSWPNISFIYKLIYKM